jgi:hypothetical protein
MWNWRFNLEVVDDGLRSDRDIKALPVCAQSWRGRHVHVVVALADDRKMITIGDAAVRMQFCTAPKNRSPSRIGSPG